jgi:hypothetical protein
MESEPSSGDHPLIVEQFVRAYTVPNNEKIARRRRSRNPRWTKRQFARATDGAQTNPQKKSHAFRLPLSDEGRAIKEMGAPYEGWCLVFDTETTTDAAQSLRFGVFELHGLDRDTIMRFHRSGDLTRERLDTLAQAGIFYDPDALSTEEIALAQSSAEEQGLLCLTRAEFIDFFYEWAYRREALCIGHNLPFDLSRLATDWAAAQRDFRGGFTLKLCDRPYGMRCFDHPPVRIKMLARYKARIAVQKGKPLARNNGDEKKSRFYATKVTAGRFLDTATLGRALLGPGNLTLRGLCQRFNTTVRKAKADAHGVRLTQEYLDHARQDVSATWALYQAERDLYRRHGLSKPIWKILSEATLGKACLEEMGIPRFLTAHPEVAPEIHGYGMVGYYGGRSEVRIRLQPTEVRYCDFKSQYPTVNALLGLQGLLLARTVMVRDATPEVRDFLATVRLEDLQHVETWRRLRGFVKLRPSGDLLPVRAQFGPEGRNIADAYVSGPPIWYALPDVVASVLRTGKFPEILEAIELIPSAERVETKPWSLFGDERYAIDLTQQDFFTEVINLRSAVKADLELARREGREDDAAYLDGLQLALKLLANSTSYGALVEVNTEAASTERQPLTVYSWRIHETATTVLERPGGYFAGAVGALIPAGGRLLLAIAERLAADRGITYAMCDTDSMAFARPDDMTREVFCECVAEIRDWFTPLSPYRGQPPLFEDEEENSWQGQPEPLYILPISAKRYALYNRLPDGARRIRKFSSHGVGTWTKRSGYVSPPHIPAPCGDVQKLGGERWQYDLWYDAIAAIDGGTLPDGRPTPIDAHGAPRYVVPADSEWLSAPAFHKLAITTWNLYQACKHIEGLRPFNFLTVLPVLSAEDIFHRQRRIEHEALAGRVSWEEVQAAKARYEVLAGVTFIAPYAETWERVREVRRTDTGEVVGGIEHRTLGEALRDYFQHPEWKSGDPRGIGLLPRRHVTVLRHVAIGKESNAIALQAAEETDGAIGGREAGIDAAQMFDQGTLQETLSPWSVADLVRATGLKRSTMRDLRSGRITRPSPAILSALRVGLSRLVEENRATTICADKCADATLASYTRRWSSQRAASQEKDVHPCER